MDELMEFIWSVAIIIIKKKKSGTHLGLEGAVEGGEEVRAGGERQHPLLHHGALRVLVLEEDVLLQHLDGKEALAASLLGQQHLQQTCREFSRRPVAVFVVRTVNKLGLRS